jgi:hypothetical protein
VIALNDKHEGPDLPDGDNLVLCETDVADKRKIAARKRDTVTMANHSMAFTDETNLGKIFKSITKEWPEGKASIVTALLKAKHVPQDMMT